MDEMKNIKNVNEALNFLNDENIAIIAKVKICGLYLIINIIIKIYF
jgi:hypothetical protein